MFFIRYQTVELKVLITHDREWQILRDKRAEHEYNPNAKKKKVNSARQDTDFVLLLFKRKCWNADTNSKDACAEV